MTANPEPRVDLLEDVDPEGCSRLLSALNLGRLAVIDGGRPVIIVLNYALLGPDLVFRTGTDARLVRLTADGQSIDASFEVDSAFPAGRSGWSVIAAGTLGRESDPQRQAEARSLVVAWAEGERDTVLRLRVEQLTGRRIRADAGGSRG